jgi:hypothetical protein
VNVHTVLLILAFVCFIVDALWMPTPNPPRVKLTPLGLALLALSYLVA